MKKIFTLFIIILSFLFVNAQNADRVFNRLTPSSDGIIHSLSQQRTASPHNSVQALWDIQFGHNLTPVSVVGCVYTGTEFWICRWNTDTMYTLDTLGIITSTFIVTGVGTASTGVRGLTYDGTNIFAVTGNNKVIYKINPATKTLVGSNTATTVPFNLRSITFDSTANAGAGGFWVSNYNSGFYHISRTGTVLDSIGAAAHGISNVYGIAFDPYTSGGPYLWAHLLGAGGNEATLKRVQIPTGASTVSHDVNIDFGPGITAGSVSITWRYRPGTWTIMGVGQGAPDVFFGYELADYIPPSLDASADSLVFDPPYTIIPTFEVVPYSWQVKATNGGTTTITDLTTTFKLTDGVTDYYAPAATHDANVAPFSSVYNNFGPFIPATGLYFEQALVSTGSQTDVNANNDTAMVPLLSVEDSVYAREAGTSTGSLGIGDGIGGTLGQYFTLSQPADITTATFLLNAPTAGDFTSVDLYSFSGTPQTILASSADYTFTTADTDGVVLHLPFIGGPISVPAGDYFLGVNEHAFNVTLARTAFNYRPNSTFVTFTGAPWAPSESFGFPVTYLLRLNVHPSTVNVNEVEESSKISVYPNPSNGKIFIRNNASANEYVINVFNSVGQVVYQQSYSNQMNAVVDLSKQANGVYSIQVKSSDEVVTQSVIITHD